MSWPVTSVILTLVFFICVVLLFVGATIARKGTTFWAIRTITSGVNLLLIGSTILLVFRLLAIPLNLGLPFELAMDTVGHLFISLGLLVYIIGFFGFCARWNAIGKRSAELIEITAALTAAKLSQARTTHSPPSS